MNTIKDLKSCLQCCHLMIKLALKKTQHNSFYRQQESLEGKNYLGITTRTSRQDGTSDHVDP